MDCDTSVGLLPISEDHSHPLLQPDTCVLEEKQVLGFVSSAQINQGNFDFVTEEVQEPLSCDVTSVNDAIGVKDIVNSHVGFSEIGKLEEGIGKLEEGLAASSSAVGESHDLDLEAFLEVKKQKLLKELEIRFVLDDENRMEKVSDFESSRNMEGFTKVKELGESFLGFVGKSGNVEDETHNADTDGKGSCSEGQRKLVENDGKMGDLQVNRGLGRCSLKLDLVDDTALIESVFVSAFGNGREKKARFVCSAKETEKKGNKNAKQEHDDKKAKKSRRRGKCMKKVSEMSERQTNVNHITTAQIGCRESGDGTKRMYSRNVMEVLRFAKTVEQRKLWKKIYAELGSTVASEYDDLVKHPRNIHLNCDPLQSFGKKELTPGVLRELCSEDVDVELESVENNETDTVNFVDFGCIHNDIGEDAMGSEDSDSDEDYASIQRPAFMVDGDPNFDSGPPEDGLEYLRRVRWEAAQIPKVKVAKIDRCRFSDEQSSYMPKIPDIPKCPGHLLPSKRWEDAFLADFTDMRQALCKFEGYIANSGELQSMCIHEKDQSGESTLLEKFGTLCVNPEANETSPDLEKWIPESSGNYPTLRAIVGMNPVARASMLRKRINSIDTMSCLSRNDCVWLYALCVAVDTPADADTCAALRTLLRKCASLRAGKSELDDEVVMLNILATISGRYFGQLEK